MAVFTHNLNYEGAPITLLDLVRALKREFGYAVTVLSPVEGPLRADFETSGIPVEIIPPQPVEGDRETTRTALKALARRLEGLRAEMVLANTLQSWHGVMAAHEAGLGAVWWQHESEPFDRYFDYLAPAVRPFAYAAFGAARRVVQVAEATRQIWLPIETRGNFEVIAHAAPPERREAELARWTRGSAREQLKARPDEVMVLITGSVCARKGQEDLVAALGALPERDAARMRLLIVGPIAELSSPSPSFRLCGRPGVSSRAWFPKPACITEPPTFLCAQAAWKAPRASFMRPWPSAFLSSPPPSTASPKWSKTGSARSFILLETLRRLPSGSGGWPGNQGCEGLSAKRGARRLRRLQTSGPCCEHSSAWCASPSRGRRSAARRLNSRSSSKPTSASMTSLS